MRVPKERLEHRPQRGEVAGVAEGGQQHARLHGIADARVLVEQTPHDHPRQLWLAVLEAARTLGISERQCYRIKAREKRPVPKAWFRAIAATL